MILTCPQCATQYVVKDDAIPAGGRKVRCRSCSASWHQDPAPAEAASAAAAEPEGALIFASRSHVTDAPPAAPMGSATVVDAGLPNADDVPVVAATIDPVVAPVAAEPDETPVEDAYSSEPTESWTEAPADEQIDEDFRPFPDRYESPAKSRRGLVMVVILALVIAAAAAAFYYFAPSEWRARAGLVGQGDTPLKLMVTNSDRQQLASGNEVFAVSGRVINPTDQQQAVPELTAELRNNAGKLIYRWVIAPPARTLGPGGSASFNSAEVDVPKGADRLTVTLGNPA